MLSHLAHLFAGFTLLLSAEASLPGIAGLSLPGTDRRCTATHKHATESRTERRARTEAPARAQVQILSFGP